MKNKIKTISIVFILIFVFATQNIYAKDNKESITVTLGGDAFGIKMLSDGVLVVKTQKVTGENNDICPAQIAGIKENDIITTAQGEKLKNNEHLKSIIENSKGKEINIVFTRNNKTCNTTITPIKDNSGVYKAGMWIKDSAAGIGTITFYDNESGGFCGLGHGICDSETGTLMPILTGEVDRAYITSVTKSRNGSVGCLNGYFTDEDIGQATINSKNGIYGITDNYHSGIEIELGDRNDVRNGEAYIYTTVRGNEIKKYEAEILKSPKIDSKDMILIITDKDLLYETGGIVQGMSGSPIVQDNKLVGALTHVIIDDVVRGYGIYADRMYEMLETVCN